MLGRADWSSGNQGRLVPRFSSGMTSNPGKGVDDGMGATVSVGSAVNVDDMGEGDIVGGTSVAAGAHPLAKSVNVTSVRSTDQIDFLIALSFFDFIRKCLTVCAVVVDG